MLVGRARWLMFLVSFLFAPLIYADYDLVISNGRVIDPQTGLDGVRFIGINNGSIEMLSTDPKSSFILFSNSEGIFPLGLFFIISQKCT